MNPKANKFFQRLIKQLLFIVGLYAVLAVLMGLGVIDNYTSSIMTTASIYVIIALGLNLVTGITGQLVLGQAGFMAVGAYATAIMLQAGFPIFFAIVLAALFTALVGLVVGVLAFRLRGDYLAIVTLGFGEIIRVVLMNLDKLTGGAAGLMNIRGISITFGNPTLTNFLWVSMFMLLAILAVVHLLTSSHGRAILSVRENEIAAESMGINIYYTKLFAFVLSTVLAGVAGGLFASQYGYLNPSMFDFLKSMDFLVIVVFGGLGSITGTVLASFLLVLLQEELRVLQDYRLVFYPLLLILMMIFRPQGLLGTREFALHRTVLRRQWWTQELPLLLGKLRSRLQGRKGANGNANS